MSILFYIFFEIIVNIRLLKFQLQCYKSTLDVLCDIYLYTRPTLKVPLLSSINFSSKSYSNFWTGKEIRLALLLVKNLASLLTKIFFLLNWSKINASLHDWKFIDNPYI